MEDSTSEILVFAEAVSTELAKARERLIRKDEHALLCSMQKLEEQGDTINRVLAWIPQSPTKSQLHQLLWEVLQFLVENNGTSVTHKNNGLTCDPCPIQKGTGGRGSYIIDVEKVNKYRRAGMTWTNISDVLCVSRRTLFNHCQEISLMERLTDAEVKEVIDELKKEDPSCGEYYVSGEIRARGHRVSRQRVKEQLRLQDPMGTALRVRSKVKRRTYHVKGPNYLWHMDANLKLCWYGIYIHGIVDGFSRKVMGLGVSNNKLASTVCAFFQNALCRFGVPRRVRSDKGGENIDVAKLMLQLRGTGNGAFITGRSVHNVRIERFWGEVNRMTFKYRQLFFILCQTNQLDLDNALDVFSLHYVFIPHIQEVLNRFAKRWSYHKIRTANHKTPNQLYASGCKASSVPFNQPPSNGDHLLTLPCEEAHVWSTFAKLLCPNPREIKEGDLIPVYKRLRSSLKNLHEI